MSNPGQFTRAIVRGVPQTFDRCIRPHGETDAIDVGLAREQHADYCATLEKLGVELSVLDADDRYPDCCFVEDTAVVVGDVAFVCEMGADTRRGEQDVVVGELERNAGRTTVRLEAPATMDGGDVILSGDKLFVGLTARTNESAVRQLEKTLRPRGVDVVGVPVSGVLHLKSACTPVAPGAFLISEPFAGAEAFAGYERLVVPRDEAYAANCLAVNGTVVLSDGFPRAREIVESRGIPTEALVMSEFRKGGGSLTCLSILL